MPVAGGAERVHICEPADHQYGFAWLNCPEDNRLYIHIKDTSETIYYGFQKTQIQNRTFQIRDPSGTIVFGSTIPTAGNPGYINTWDEAVAGPAPIAGASGYTALVFNPADTGDYSFEFQATTTLLYMDITVVDSLDVPVDGRMWSKAWQFSTGSAPGFFDGSLFVYSDDGIVTELDLNGMQGITFTVACNQYGCPDPNNPGSYTRKSVNGKHIGPQYKIFFNDPDSTVYPTGILGEISNMLITWDCDGTATINFDVTVAATIDILLNINPLPGKQEEDVLIVHNATVGTNTVTWNGMNGLTPPEPVSDSTIFDVIITYILGLTNFPVYDVEQNLNGYIVNLIRPTGPIPNLYWDDLELVLDPQTNCPSGDPPPPDANYSGCPGNLGCHSWESVMTNPPNPSQCSYPNRNTANTWWYAVYSNSTLPDFIVHRVPFPPGQPDGDANVCPGTTSVTYTIDPEPNSTEYQWEYTGTGATFNPPDPYDTAAILDFSENASGGYLKVRGYNANCGFGAWDSLYINIYPIPDLSNNPPRTEICNGQPTGITLTSGVAGATFTWTCTQTSGNITGYSDNPGPGTTILNQTLSLTGVVEDSVLYILTPAANGCYGEDTTYIVVVNPVPELTTTPLEDSICSDQTTSIQLTANCQGTSFSWTSEPGTGSVTGNTDGSGDLIADLLVNAATTSGNILYHIIPSTSSCTGFETSYTMWVKPLPHLSNQPLWDSICNNTSPGIALTATLANTWFTWTATGSSVNISGYSDQTTPATLLDQTLTNSGFDMETATYTITPSSSGCIGPDSIFEIAVYPTPDLYFIPNGETICEGNTSNIQIGSHVTGSAFSWTATASSPNLTGYSDGTGALIAQVVENNGPTIETVTYQVTPEANACPPGTMQQVTLTVNPRPVVTSSPDKQMLCNGSSTSFSLSGDVAGTSFAWRSFTASSDITGYGNGSGSLIAQTLFNSAYNTDSVTYRIAGTANGCLGDSTDIQAVVYPVADVLIFPDADTLCSGFTTNFLLQSQVTGTSFSWTASGSDPTVSGYSNGSGDLILQTLLNSGYMMPDVTYVITPEANGCTGTSNSTVVRVNPLPVVSFTPCFDTITTTGAQPIRLRGNTPSGGIFNGNGVYETSGGSSESTWYFNPALAGPGTHEIKYTYTNDFGCRDSASTNIFNFQFSIFNCGDSLLDIRDSFKYPTVEINGQCWMASNLNYGTQIASSRPQRDNCIPEKFCFDDNPALCALSSALYQWDEVMQYESQEAVQGFCPPGWHIPTEAEWDALFSNYVSSGFAGNALKYTGYSGFDALLTGVRFHNQIWKYPGTNPVLRSTLFWSSSYHASGKAWAHGMNEVAVDIEYTPSVSYYPALVNNAFAIRCIKD